MTIPSPPPMPSSMFPHSVTLHRLTWSSDVEGGGTPGDSTATVSANVQSAGMDKSDRVAGDEAHAVGSVAFYDVSFASDPSLKVDDSIAWNGLTMLVQAKPSYIARFGIYRVRCLVRS